MLTARELDVEVPMERRVETVIGLLRHDIGKDWRVGEMATAVNLSVTHLRRLFTAHTGLAPKQFLCKERLALAHGLLKDTHLTVKEVMARSGFVDRTAFNRAFRRHFAASPNQVRCHEIPCGGAVYS